MMMDVIKKASQKQSCSIASNAVLTVLLAEVPTAGPVLFAALGHDVLTVQLSNGGIGDTGGLRKILVAAVEDLNAEKGRI